MFKRSLVGFFVFIVCVTTFNNCTTTVTMANVFVTIAPPLYYTYYPRVSKKPFVGNKPSSVPPDATSCIMT